MKPTVKPVKSIFGKRKGFVAEFGSLTTKTCEKQGEAIDELERMLSRLADSDDTPHIVAYGGYAVLVARTISGWGSRIIFSPEDGIHNGGVQLSSGDCWDRKEAIHVACYHVAQIAWKPGEDMPYIVPNSRMGEFTNWMEFQNRYREAIDKGMSDVDAHSYAGRNPARPELWTCSRG